MNFRYLTLGFVFLGIIQSGFALASSVDRVIRFEGVDRTYSLYIPDHLSAQPKLVVALHGASGNAPQMARITRFNSVAEKEGFVVVYPEGLRQSGSSSGSWNASRKPGSQVLTRRGFRRAPDDVGFLNLVITSVLREFNINDSAAYLVGVSNGGMMTLRMACESKFRFSAYAVMIANFPKTLFKNCQNPHQASILFMHGVDDPIIDYNGGSSLLSAEATIDFWVKVNTCQLNPQSAMLPNINSRDDTQTQLDSWSCAQRTEVKSYKVFGGGHTWAGYPVGLEPMLGKTSFDYDASQEILDFFSKRNL